MPMPNAGRSRSRKVADVILAPLLASTFTGCQKRGRKAAPRPQPVHGRGAGLVELEGRELDVPDAPGQGFRRLADPIARGAAENQEPGRILRPIDEYAQHREELRRALDLVDDHQPAQILQGQLGLGQGRQIGWVFKVEAGRRGVRQAAGIHLCQCRLAALARAEQRDDGLDLEAGRDLRPISISFHA